MNKIERNKKVAEMYLMGFSLRQISREFNCSHQNVALILIKLNILTRRPVAKKRWCNMCRCKLIAKKNSHYSNERCFSCIKKRRQMWCTKLNLNACIECKRSSVRHQSKGLCSKCNSKKRYKDPEYRKSHLLLTKAWRKKNKFAWNMYQVLRYYVKKDNKW